MLAARHWREIAVGAIYITIATLTAFTLSLTVFGLPPASAVTPSFLTLALAQLWHVFNMRATGSNWLHNEVTRNPFVWGALGLCLILIVTPVTTPAAALLGLEPPRAAFLAALALSLVPLIPGQLAKAFPRPE